MVKSLQKIQEERKRREQEKRRLREEERRRRRERERDKERDRGKDKDKDKASSSDSSVKVLVFKILKKITMISSILFKIQLFVDFLVMLIQEIKCLLKWNFY